MENSPNSSQTSPKTGMKTFWKVFIVVIVSIVVAGGGVWYFESTKAKSQKDDLNSQIALLQSQVKDLQTKAATSTTTTSTTTTTNSTAATADWKTLAGSFGYTIKYPTDLFTFLALKLGPNSGEGLDRISTLENGARQTTQDALDLDIYRYANSKNDTIDSLYTAQLAQYEKDKQTVKIEFSEDIQKIKINNVDAVRNSQTYTSTDSLGTSQDKNIYVYIPHGNYIYLLRGNVNQHNSETIFNQNVALALQMIETFQFTQ